VKNKTNPTWEHFKSLLFVLFLCELVLFFIGIIFGRIFGYRLTLFVCLWFGLILAICYALIVASNVGAIFVQRLYFRIKNMKRRASPSS
jgi:hypothetical protein